MFAYLLIYSSLGYWYAFEFNITCYFYFNKWITWFVKTSKFLYSFNILAIGRENCSNSLENRNRFRRIVNPNLPRPVHTVHNFSDWMSRTYAQYLIYDNAFFKNVSQQYPWVAHLQIITNTSLPKQCGAAIRDEITIVSAAHCFVNRSTGLPLANMLVKVSAGMLDQMLCEDEPYKQVVFVCIYLFYI